MPLYWRHQLKVDQAQYHINSKNHKFSVIPLFLGDSDDILDPDNIEKLTRKNNGNFLLIT